MYPIHRRGVLMRRQEGGIGCGARGRGSYPRTREALASRPPALRPAAFNGWTWRGRRAAEAARIRGREERFRPAPGSTAPGTEKPLVARREAPRLRKKACTVGLAAPFRRAIPSHSSRGGRRKPDYGRTRRPPNNTGDNARPNSPASTSWAGAPKPARAKAGARQTTRALSHVRVIAKVPAIRITGGPAGHVNDDE
jgi:hypothetical protein